jgi:hypothetical protein
MDISIYKDFFHDGSLLAIEHQGKTIVLSMKSAEVDQEELPGNIVLSSDDRIKGKLHITNVKNIEVNEEPFLGVLTKDYDFAEILDFEMDNDHTILLGINWGNYPPRPNVSDFSTIKIKAEKIWWENTP